MTLVAGQHLSVISQDLLPASSKRSHKSSSKQEGKLSINFLRHNIVYKFVRLNLTIMMFMKALQRILITWSEGKKNQPCLENLFDHTFNCNTDSHYVYGTQAGSVSR
jgi:hypothetical protein